MLFGAGAGTLPACGGGDDDPRPAVLDHVAHAVAVPEFAAFAGAAEAARGALADLCAETSTSTLTAARDAWHAERDAWNRTLPFAFGPRKVEQNALDFWPVRPTSIEGAVAAAPDDVDAAHVAGLGVAARGLPALEYLLWGDDPAAVLADLSDPAQGARRCAYARALADDIAARAAALAAAWTDEYAAALADAGRGSAVYPSIQRGLDEVVNAVIDALLTMVKSRLDAPLGNLTGAAVDPTLLESRYAGRAADDLRASLAGVWAVYHGADPDAPAAGLSVLVRARDPRLDDRVRAQHARVLDVLDALPGPLADVIVTDRNAVQTVRDELDTLRRLLKLEVASQLGVTLSLTDNDGD